MNITQALSLLVNATIKNAIRCDHCGHDDEEEGGHDCHDMDDMDMGMKMWFHVGHSEVVLFEEWTFDSVGGLVGSAVGIFFLAVFYEAWKFGRELFAKKMQKVTKDTKQTPFNLPHLIQTLLHAVQFILSYFLMFIFMTYNVWLCLAVILGGGVGYFLFAWKKTSVGDLTEHCH